MATPLVDWEKLVLPTYCNWHAGLYGLRPSTPEAQQRATALLLAHLDEQQRADYLRMQRFATRGASGVVYVMGLTLYPTSIRDGKAYERFCAPPNMIHWNHLVNGYEIPMEDLVLTWKLFIEGAEADFLYVAQGAPANRR